MYFLLCIFFVAFTGGVPVNTCFDARHSWSQEKPVIGHMSPGVEWVQKNWEPSIRCLYEKRLGLVGDGGKHVCDPVCLYEHVKNCTVFSIGSNNEFSFELALQPFCSNIHTFDHTVNDPKPPIGVTFHKIGVGKSPLKTFQELLFLTKIRTVHIFKIDIEGGEFDFFNNETINLMRHAVQQLLIEFHIGGMDRRKVNTLVSMLTENGFLPFSKEPNINYSNGECFEMSLINVNKNFF